MQQTTHDHPAWAHEVANGPCTIPTDAELVERIRRMEQAMSDVDASEWGMAMVGLSPEDAAEAAADFQTERREIAASLGEARAELQFRASEQFAR